MKNMSISIKDCPKENQFHDMIKSLINRRLINHCELCKIHVDLSKSKDNRVPFNVVITATLNDDLVLESKAASANSLAAFTQALARLERRFDSQKRA